MNITSDNKVAKDEISIYQLICKEYAKQPLTPYKFQDVYEAGRMDVIYNLKHGRNSTLEKEILASKLTDHLIKASNTDNLIKSLKSQPDNPPIFCYLDLLSSRIKTLFNEDIFDNDKLYFMGYQLARESSSSEKVKLGILILGLFENDISKSIIHTLSLHSEFTLYGIEAMRDWIKPNSILFDLAKNTTGFGKLAAIHYLQAISHEQKQWIFESGPINDSLPHISAIACLNKGDMDMFYNKLIVTENSFHCLSRLFAYAFEQNDLKAFPQSLHLVTQYMNKAKEYASKFIDLSAIMMIMKSMKPYWLDSGVDVEKENVWTNNKENEIRIKCLAYLSENISKNKKWEFVLAEEMNHPKEENSLIIETLKMQGKGKAFTPPVFESFIPMLMKDNFDFDIMEYLLIKHPDLYLKRVFYTVRNGLPNKIFGAPLVIETNSLTRDHKPDIWLVYLLKGMYKLKLYDEAFFLACLKARLQDVRIEAIACLRAIKPQWSSTVIPSLENSLKSEPDTKIKRRIHRLLGTSNSEANKEQRYIDVSNIKVIRHPSDTILLNTTIAGAFYRDMKMVKDYLSYGDILYLKHEADNKYDSNAILVLAEDGYVLGYIPKEHNSILLSLINSDKVLYAILDDEIKEYGGRPQIEIRLSQNPRNNLNLIRNIAG